jgi:hypothetical protein
VSIEDPKVATTLQQHAQVCVQLQAAILGSSSFRLWVQPEELAVACQALATAKGGSCLLLLQAAVQAHVCKLHQQVQEQVQLLQQQLQIAEAVTAADLASQQQHEERELQHLQREQAPARQQQQQPGRNSIGPPAQNQQQKSETVVAEPHDFQQLADNSRAAKKPRMAATLPPPLPQPQQKQRRSQRSCAKGAAPAKAAGSQPLDAMQVQQSVTELQQNISSRQTRSSSRLLAAAANSSLKQQTIGAARTGMLPAASAAAGKAAAMLQSTMRSAKQQLLQMASSLGKRTHQQMKSGSK